MNLIVSTNFKLYSHNNLELQYSNTIFLHLITGLSFKIIRKKHQHQTPSPYFKGRFVHMLDLSVPVVQLKAIYKS